MGRSKTSVESAQTSPRFLVRSSCLRVPEKITYRIKDHPEKRYLDIALVEWKGAILALVYTCA